jgi:hypothetical protein
MYLNGNQNVTRRNDSNSPLHDAELKSIIRRLRFSRPAGSAGVVAAAAIALAITTLPGAASAAVTGDQPAVPGPLSVPGALTGVATLSSSSAWAVGATATHQPTPVLAHWDGKKWATVDSPAVPPHTDLRAAASFPGGAWAVGEANVNDLGPTGIYGQPLILRLTGTKAHRVPTPKVGAVLLHGVAATSAKDAWAVGAIRKGPALILHWDGRKWTRSSPPGRSVANFLVGVAATSAKNAWAVGASPKGHGVILHWNGSRWTPAAIPSQDKVPFVLTGVAAISARNAWAVGYTSDITIATTTVILHWDGTRWKRVQSTDPFPGGEGDGLMGVSATSARNALAVGGSFTGLDGIPMSERWNGTSWTTVKTPGSEGTLNAVSIGTSGSGWGVGEVVVFGASPQTLIRRWNGSAWH